MKSKNNIFHPDFDTLGIFKEMSYNTIGVPFSNNVTKIRSVYKGKQMCTNGSKTKSANNDGYFNNFIRIFNGDCKIDYGKYIRRQKIVSSKLNKGKSWIPPHNTPKLNGYGSHYNTFSGPIQYMRPTVKSKSTYKSEKKNFYTSPGKKGTSSYVDVTINKYPNYQNDPYDKKYKNLNKILKPFYLNMYSKKYFNENPYQNIKMTKRLPASSSSNKIFKNVFKPSSFPKTMGGCKDGCFNSYPIYKTQFVKPNKCAKIHNVVFKLSSGPKPYPITSIIDVNIKKKINIKNYKTFLNL